MFTMLLEDPTTYIVFGVLTEAILGIMLLRTGRGVLLWAMAGVLVAVIVGVTFERLWVTERERVAMTIDAAAAAVGANDPKLLDAYLAPETTEPRRLISWAMQQVKFEKVKVTRCDVRIIKTTSPWTAKADLSIVVYFKDPRGEIPYTQYPAEGTLDFRREGDKWLVTGYTMKNDPRGQQP